MTRKGTPLTRTCLPVGSSSPKRFWATVCPSRQTFCTVSTSASVSSRPLATLQSRMLRKSGVVPRSSVLQFMFPATSWAAPRCSGATRSTLPHSARMAFTSSRVRVGCEPMPAWMPPLVVEPARTLPVASAEADAVSALVALGFKPAEASRAVALVEGDDLSSEELIRRALKGMA